MTPRCLSDVAATGLRPHTIHHPLSARCVCHRRHLLVVSHLARSCACRFDLLTYSIISRAWDQNAELSGGSSARNQLRLSHYLRGQSLPVVVGPRTPDWEKGPFPQMLNERGVHIHTYTPARSHIAVRQGLRFLETVNSSRR